MINKVTYCAVVLVVADFVAHLLASLASLLKRYNLE
jgi:hypothetical protein